jgi:hypothetical protein
MRSLNTFWAVALGWDVFLCRRVQSHWLMESRLCWHRLHGFQWRRSRQFIRGRHRQRRRCCRHARDGNRPSHGVPDYRRCDQDCHSGQGDLVGCQRNVRPHRWEKLEYRCRLDGLCDHVSGNHRHELTCECWYQAEGIRNDNSVWSYARSGCLPWLERSFLNTIDTFLSFSPTKVRRYALC